MFCIHLRPSQWLRRFVTNMTSRFPKVNHAYEYLEAHLFPGHQPFHSWYLKVSNRSKHSKLKKKELQSQDKAPFFGRVSLTYTNNYAKLLSSNCILQFYCFKLNCSSPTHFCITKTFELRLNKLVILHQLITTFDWKIAKKKLQRMECKHPIYDHAHQHYPGCMPLSYYRGKQPEWCVTFDQYATEVMTDPHSSRMYDISYATYVMNIKVQQILDTTGSATLGCFYQKIYTAPHPHKIFFLDKPNSINAFSLPKYLLMIKHNNDSIIIS